MWKLTSRSAACALGFLALASAGAQLPAAEQAIEEELGLSAAALEAGDECLNSEPGADQEHCALSALQLHGQKAGSSEFAKSFEARRAEAERRRAEALEAVLRLQEEEAEAALTEEARAWQAELLSKYNISVPQLATTYDGISWPTLSLLEGSGDPSAAPPANGATPAPVAQAAPAASAAPPAPSAVVHVFAIGDWGAVLPRHLTAPNKRVMGGVKKPCPMECGYVHGIDDRAQILVAEQMKRRAAKSNPQYVLNVGDNFYWAGLRMPCGQGGGAVMAAFAAGWQSMYGSLAQKPWFSVLGNHDYGGWQFNAGWDQQIKYSFSNQNWVMPARYFSRRVEHPGFSVEYFMIDSNVFDAHVPDFDTEHNICGGLHNPPGATCAHVGGPASVASCAGWFQSSYQAQKQWLEQKLAASTADWQVVVTHFPCGHESGWYAKLHKQLGLDLLVTGHRHDQELWGNSGALGGLTCFVTGGGGGITSESPPTGSGASGQYGFFDLAFSKSEIVVQSINLNGEVIGSATVNRA